MGQYDFEKMRRKKSPRKNRSPEPLDMYLNSKSNVSPSGYTTGAQTSTNAGKIQIKKPRKVKKKNTETLENIIKS